MESGSNVSDNKKNDGIEITDLAVDQQKVEAVPAEMKEKTETDKTKDGALGFIMIANEHLIEDFNEPPSAELPAGFFELYTKGGDIFKLDQQGHPYGKPVGRYLTADDKEKAEIKDADDKEKVKEAGGKDADDKDGA